MNELKSKKEFYLPEPVFRNILDFCGEPLPNDIITNKEIDYDKYKMLRRINLYDFKDERGLDIKQYRFYKDEGLVNVSITLKRACNMCKRIEYQHTGYPTERGISNRCEGEVFPIPTLPSV